MISRPLTLSVIFACGTLSLARGVDASPPSSPSGATDSSPAVTETADSSATDSAELSTYKTEKGDTVFSVAHQFHCTSAELKKLNNLKHTKLKTGLVLQIPAGHGGVASAKHKKTSAKLASDKTAKTSRHHHALVAQPVQDFDVSPSTFASCPAPASNADENVPVTVIPEGTQITSSTPTGPTSTPDDLPPSLVGANHRASLLPVPTTIAPVTPPTTTASTEEEPDKTFTAHQNIPSAVTGRQAPATVLNTAPPQRSGFANALANFFGGSHNSESGEWGNRFLSSTRDLAAHGVGYDDAFRPDGEAHSWEMDCSNTSRYLYRVTAGIQLPRTASDQYYYLHLQDKAWDVPMTSRGFADCNFLRSNLKPGDLLFWENTYRPERQPPITHVMIFLGSDSKGRWLMAGSQNGHHGFYNPARTGPDVYVFDPTHYAGGYTTWLGLVHHHGRFVAYGRPLEADVKKLSVASDN